MKFVLRSLKEFLIAALLTLLCVLLFPFLLLLFLLPIYTFRLVTAKVLKPLFRRDLGNLLTLQSSFIAVDDPWQGSPKWNIVVWSIFEGSQDGPAYFSKFKKHVLYRQLPNGQFQYPEFQQYFLNWLGFFFWKSEANFKAEDHMRIYSGSADGVGEAVTESKFQEIVKEWTWAPFREGSSPWEILWVNNYRTEVDKETCTKSAMLFRVHHALCDGYQIFNIKIDHIALHPFTSKLEPHSGKRRSLLVSRAWDGFWAGALGPFHTIKSYVESKDVNSLMPRGRALSLPFNIDISPGIPLQVIKDIKNFHGTSFNSVIVAAVTGGLRRVMLENGLKVPSFMSTGILLPLPRHPRNMRNHWTSAYLRLPVGMEDSTARLKYIERRLQDLKRSCVPQFNYLLMLAVGGLGSGLTKRLNKNDLSTLCISSFPGPTEYLKLRDELGEGDPGPEYRLLDMGFTVGNGGGEHGIAFFVESYGEHLKITAEVECEILGTDDEVRGLNLFILDEISILHSRAASPTWAMQKIICMDLNDSSKQV